MVINQVILADLGSAKALKYSVMAIINQPITNILLSAAKRSFILNSYIKNVCLIGNTLIYSKSLYFQNKLEIKYFSSKSTFNQ